ncbi:hypothetical protein LTR35_009942 [Friedmanniomyces endolithicus]|nr:hypothetical protein LTR35_009942 [Friedmanniomyces endolithicus]KAK0980876.1 hypothetical protein LTR54_015185 [Friedmanniomyces endolithicus]
MLTIRPPRFKLSLIKQTLYQICSVITHSLPADETEPGITAAFSRQIFPKPQAPKNHLEARGGPGKFTSHAPHFELPNLQSNDSPKTPPHQPSILQPTGPSNSFPTQPSIMTFVPLNPRPMLQSLVNEEVLIRLKWGQTEYTGRLVSVDSYMNVQLSGAEEWVGGKNAGTLGQVLIR